MTYYVWPIKVGENGKVEIDALHYRNIDGRLRYWTVVEMGRSMAEDCNAPLFAVAHLGKHIDPVQALKTHYYLVSVFRTARDYPRLNLWTLPEAGAEQSWLILSYVPYGEKKPLACQAASSEICQLDKEVAYFAACSVFDGQLPNWKEAKKYLVQKRDGYQVVRNGEEYGFIKIQPWKDWLANE